MWRFFCIFVNVTLVDEPYKVIQVAEVVTKIGLVDVEVVVVNVNQALRPRGSGSAFWFDFSFVQMDRLTIKVYVNALGQVSEEICPSFIFVYIRNPFHLPTNGIQYSAVVFEKRIKVRLERGSGELLALFIQRFKQKNKAQERNGCAQQATDELCIVRKLIRLQILHVPGPMIKR